MPPPSQPDSRTPSDAQPAREFTAVVTEIRELGRIAGKPVFQVALDHSAFQPAECPPGGSVGTLTATSRLGSILVAPISAVHRDASGELWHTTVKPLQPGTPVVGFCNGPM